MKSASPELSNKNSSLEILRDELAALETATEEAQRGALKNLIFKSSHTYQEKEANLPSVALQKRELITDFISSHPKICENENFSIPHFPQSKDTMTPAESRSLQQKSLLCALFGAVPNDYSIKIINQIIAESRDLSKRHDLFLQMVFDRVICSEMDLTPTFKLLATKNIPHPSDFQILDMSRHERMKGNASRIALSFFEQNDDVTVLKKIMDLPEATFDKKILEKNFKDAAAKKSGRDLAKYVNCAIRINNDRLLETVLKTKSADGQLVAARMPDEHGLSLYLAAENKFIKTFEILINAGFNPLNHPQGVTNSFALACKTQSKATLDPYLKAIKEKHGTAVVERVVNEIDAAEKTALSHAIDGKAYLTTIEFLLKNDADIAQNFAENLKSASRNGHAGAFDLLLKKGHLKESDLENVFASVKDEGDFVATSIFLDYLKDKNHLEMVRDLKSTILQKREALADQDLFSICQTRGSETLKYYLDARPDYVLEDHVNERSRNKTPLYYAIEHNAYNNLVATLLNCGADPNLIGREEGHTEINAATLAIRGIEPQTLGLILASGKLSDKSIRDAAEELVDPQNNEAVLTQSFILGLTTEKLTSLPLNIRETLLRRSLETDSNDTIAKMREARNDLRNYAEKLFCEAIESGNLKVVQGLIENFKIKSLLAESPKSSATSLEDIDVSLTESAPLLLRPKTNYSAVEVEMPPKLSPTKTSSESLNSLSSLKLDTKYLDLAFTAVDERKSPEAKEVTKLLWESGFESAKKDKELKDNLDQSGIKTTTPRCGSLCPPSCAVM